MRSSYSEKDVTILLKDITGLVEPMPAEKREVLIQSGVHYCEMLPLEYRPGDEYMRLYSEALENYAGITGEAAATAAEKIRKAYPEEAVLVSLARAGTPAGILMKRYLNIKYPDYPVFHYTVSIIRGRGIDRNAMKYILDRHSPKSVCFVDGWTGKGAILRTLREAVKDYQGVQPRLAVLADPANIADFYGTLSDFLIPSSCLNSTVSGLMSRTFLRDDIIGPEDFHGAAYYGELASEDRSAEFIDTVMKRLDLSRDYSSCISASGQSDRITGMDEVKRIQKDFSVSDINFIKPGIGETTRVLLRRMPWKILVNDLNDSKYISHILRLAEEKNTEVIEYPLKRYRACGIIRSMADT